MQNLNFAFWIEMDSQVWLWVDLPTSPTQKLASGSTLFEKNIIIILQIGWKLVNFEIPHFCLIPPHFYSFLFVGGDHSSWRPYLTRFFFFWFALKMWYCKLGLNAYIMKFLMSILVLIIMMMKDRSPVVDSSSWLVILLFRLWLIGKVFSVVWLFWKWVHAKLDGNL